MIVPLHDGTLDVEVVSSQWPLTRLCGFASRRNPRRPFLIVSRILGKHLPADPWEQVHACDRLVDDIAKLAPPVAILGFAETATGLAQTMHERWCRRHAEDNAVYCHTTRYPLQRPLAFSLQESHSHATEHLVHWPQQPMDADFMRNARSLIVVDDEFTTGNTAANLVTAFVEACQRPEHVALVCLTNWMTEQHQQELRHRIAGQTGTTVSFHHLLQGRLRYERRVGLQAARPNSAARPDRAVGHPGPRDHLLPIQNGRLGVTKPCQFDFERMLAGLRLKQQVSVVGTGEYLYAPSCLARYLAQSGHQVTVQSSTRSPVELGQAVQSRMIFADNYGDGINNYLYNYEAAMANSDRTTLVCYETDPLPEEHDLPSRLGGQVVFPNRFLVS